MDEFRYDNENWGEQLGSPIVARVASADYSESYEMDGAHVFRLKNGKYALVTESGCSCYDPRHDAYIDLFPNEEAAMAEFNSWEREKKKYKTLNG